MPSHPTTYCSHNSRDVSLENPVGSASGFSRCFLIEVPLPWARIPLETPHIPAAVLSAIAEYTERKGKVNITLLAPDAGYAVEGVRLIDLQVVEGAISRREIIATDGDIASVIRSITHDTDLPLHARVDPTPWRDIAVCTHGTRDACCASFGIPMYMKMHLSAKSMPNTRVWRCSHLGGHRFAPTMIDYSNGRSWGLVDDACAQAILQHTATPDEIIQHYRGWVGLGSPEIQMLEAEVFAEIGWGWDEWIRTGTVLQRDSEGRGISAELIATHPEHGEIRYRGEIEWGEEFTTIASCNAEPVQYVRKRIVNVRRSEPVLTN